MRTNKLKTISIIIPVLNEEQTIGALITHLKNNSCNSNIKEILVIDGGSNDNTVSIAKQYDVVVLLSKKGRAKQMNYGAKNATGDILYFLHADTFPPKKFDWNIIKAIENGHESGCYRMCFDTRNLFLKFFASLTTFNFLICRGGDQSLFVTTTIFEKLKGYNEAYFIYEDTEFISRLYKCTNFKVLPQKVITSARKYEQNGTLRLQYHFGVIHLKNKLGAPPKKLHHYYEKHIQ